MWNLIPTKLMPPTRFVRYCCQILKEGDGKDRYIATGIRWAESSKRKRSRGVMELQKHDRKKSLILTDDNDESRQIYETALDSCSPKGKRIVNPIIDWTDEDIWDYATTERIPMNPLYGCGFSRVGCVGCPVAQRKNREREFAKWPTYKKYGYIPAFERMMEERKNKGKETKLWANGEDVFHWWIEDGVIPGQVDSFEEGDS